MDTLALLVRRRILYHLVGDGSDDSGLASAARAAQTSRAWARAWRALQCDELLDVLARRLRAGLGRRLPAGGYAYELRRSAAPAAGNPALPAASVADLLAAARAACGALRQPGVEFGTPRAVFALRDASVGELAVTRTGRAALVAAVRAPRAGAVAHELVARVCQLALRAGSSGRVDWHFVAKQSASGVASAADALLHFWPHERATPDIVARLSDAQCVELARVCDALLASCRRWRSTAAALQIMRAPPAAPDAAVRGTLCAIAACLRAARCARHGAAVTLCDTAAHALPLHCTAAGDGVFVCATPLAAAVGVSVCGKRELGHLLRDTLCETRYTRRVVLCRFDAAGDVEWTPAAACVLRPGMARRDVAAALVRAARRGAMRAAAPLARTLRARAVEALATAGDRARLHAFCAACARRAKRQCAAQTCASAAPHCPGAPAPSSPERTLHALRRMVRVET